MPSHRIDKEQFDFDTFRSFALAAGAELAEPKTAAKELIRFRVAGRLGAVSSRRDGSITVSGEAFYLFKKMSGDDLLTSIPKKATVRIVTLRATQFDEARKLLAGAKEAEVHTDGSCTRTGRGPGGWAVIIRAGFVTVEMYGGASNTTVNRMEMVAAIAALKLLDQSCAVRIKTDSRYLKDGIKKWIAGWKRNGWVTATKTPVKNVELWQLLDTLQSGRRIVWKWVPAHKGVKGNERADELARQGRYSIEAGK